MISFITGALVSAVIHLTIAVGILGYASNTPEMNAYVYGALSMILVYLVMFFIKK